MIRLEVRLSLGGNKTLPVPSEEQEVSLTVKSDYLTTLEFRQGWKKRLEKATDGVAQPSRESIEDQFRTVGRWCSMALRASQWSLHDQARTTTYRYLF